MILPSQKLYLALFLIFLSKWPRSHLYILNVFLYTYFIHDSTFVLYCTIWYCEIKKMLKLTSPPFLGFRRSPSHLPWTDSESGLFWGFSLLNAKIYFLVILESNTKLLHLLKTKKCPDLSIYLCHMQTIMNLKNQRNKCIVVEQYKCGATHLKFYLQVSVSKPSWMQWCCTSIMQGRTWSSAMSSEQSRAKKLLQVCV